MLYFGFLFLLYMLYAGSRYGGVGLGVISGIGLLVEVFIFRMPPSFPPVTVIMIIMAVVTCASVLEAAGGAEIYVAEGRARPAESSPEDCHPRSFMCLSNERDAGNGTCSLLHFSHNWRYSAEKRNPSVEGHGSIFSFRPDGY